MEQTVHHLQDLCLEHHRALGHAENTIEHYLSSLDPFRRFLEKDGRAATVDGLSTSILQAFAAWLRAPPRRAFTASPSATFTASTAS